MYALCTPFGPVSSGSKMDGSWRPRPTSIQPFHKNTNASRRGKRSSIVELSVSRFFIFLPKLRNFFFGFSRIFFFNRNFFLV